MISVHPSVVSMAIVLSCQLTIVTGVLHWVAQDDWLNVWVALVALSLTVAPVLILKRSPLRNAGSVLVALLLSAHIKLGMQMNFYESSLLYDKLVHLVGFVAIAGLLGVAIKSYCARHALRLPTGLFAAFVFATALTIGTLWEFFEFGIDSTGLFYAQRGLRDTMLDLIADAIGALCATLLLVAPIWRQHHHMPTPGPYRARNGAPSNTPRQSLSPLRR